MNIAQRRFFYKIQDLDQKQKEFIKKIILDTKNEKINRITFQFLRLYTKVNFIEKLFPNNTDINDEVNKIK